MLYAPRAMPSALRKKILDTLLFLSYNNNDEITNLHRLHFMNSTLAVNWAKWLAEYFSSRRINNPFLLAAKFGWRVVMENNDAFFPARFAEWDGGAHRIRLFIPTLRRHLGNSNRVLYCACAHELFHGLVAVQYRVLNLPKEKFPRLNNREEEIAAHAFSEALLNFHCEEETCPLSASR